MRRNPPRLTTFTLAWLGFHFWQIQLLTRSSNLRLRNDSTHWLNCLASRAHQPLLYLQIGWFNRSANWFCANKSSTKMKMKLKFDAESAYCTNDAISARCSIWFTMLNTKIVQFVITHAFHRVEKHWFCVFEIWIRRLQQSASINSLLCCFEAVFVSETELEFDLGKVKVEHGFALRKMSQQSGESTVWWIGIRHYSWVDSVKGGEYCFCTMVKNVNGFFLQRLPNTDSNYRRLDCLRGMRKRQDVIQVYLLLRSLSKWPIISPFLSWLGDQRPQMNLWWFSHLRIVTLIDCLRFEF